MFSERSINGTNKERWKDPVAWDCLTDEQRDTINEWYESIRSDEKKERKELINKHYIASFFGIIPFAVNYAYKFAGGFLSLQFLWQLLCALLVYGFIFFVFFEGYLAANHEPPTKLTTFFHMLVAIFIALVVLALIYD